MRLKKIISAVLSLCVGMVSLPVTAVEMELPEDAVQVLSEDKQITSGTCGAKGNEENVKWSFDETTRTLTISGTGEMEDYVTSRPAWCGLDFTSAVIEDGLPSIGVGAFMFCGSLTSVTIPESVTSIGESAFSDCFSLTSMTIPDSVTSIEGGAFNGCSSLTSVTIPDSVTSIGTNAFNGCSSLTSVMIPDSVTSIGSGVFSETPWLSEQFALSQYPYVIVSNILFDSNSENCTGDLVIPDGVTCIGDYVFSGCNLTSVTIPDNVTSIGDGVFLGCSSLTSVTIPESVTHIGGYAFRGTPWLEEQLDFSPYPYVVVNHIAIASDEEACTGDLIIPEGVTSIGDSAFENCDFLTSVTIPDSVTIIEDCAFFDCSSLTSVTIPDNVTSIGGDAFRDCVSLTSVTILNPDCVIDGFRSRTICNNYDIFEFLCSFTGTIYGYENSTAQNFAENFDYKFENLETAPEPVYTTIDVNSDNKDSPSENEEVRKRKETASKAAGMSPLWVAVGAAAIAGIGGSVIYFTKKKKKKT